jgi:lysophospholipid acyltransferase 5
LSGQNEKVQHLFFLLTGLLIGYWVVGAGVGHSITTILVTYLILLIAGGSLLSVVLSFSFNLTYLLVGYWYKQQEG